jgi:hypothetical protein
MSARATPPRARRQSRSSTLSMRRTHSTVPAASRRRSASPQSSRCGSAGKQAGTPLAGAAQACRGAGQHPQLHEVRPQLSCRPVPACGANQAPGSTNRPRADRLSARLACCTAALMPRGQCPRSLPAPPKPCIEAGARPRLQAGVPRCSQRLDARHQHHGWRQLHRCGRGCGGHATRWWRCDGPAGTCVSPPDGRPGGGQCTLHPPRPCDVVPFQSAAVGPEQRTAQS